VVHFGTGCDARISADAWMGEDARFLFDESRAVWQLAPKWVARWLPSVASDGAASGQWPLGASS
jgi:hypothetical protein